MTLLYIAIPVSLVVAAGFLIAFVWAARDDQFADLDTPPQRMLHDAPPLRDAGPAPSRESTAATSPEPDSKPHA